MRAGAPLPGSLPPTRKSPVTGRVRSKCEKSAPGAKCIKSVYHDVEVQYIHIPCVGYANASRVCGLPKRLRTKGFRVGLRGLRAPIQSCCIETNDDKWLIGLMCFLCLSGLPLSCASCFWMLPLFGAPIRSWERGRRYYYHYYYHYDYSSIIIIKSLLLSSLS